MNKDGSGRDTSQGRVRPSNQGIQPYKKVEKDALEAVEPVVEKKQKKE